MRFSREFQLSSISLDGCMFGLTAQSGADSGKLIKKPWRVDTHIPSMPQYLGKLCDGSHSHIRCAGRHTKLTESYTDELVAAVHTAFRQWSETKRESRRKSELVFCPVVSVKSAVCACAPSAMRRTAPYSCPLGEANLQRR